MKHAVTRELFSYWTRLRGSRSAPERGDIDPAAIRNLLADTFILEVGGGPRAPAYSIRLSGTRFNALFLAELKGRALLPLWAAADRNGMADLMSSVVDNCTPVVLGLRAAPADHRPIDLEMILLPLKHHGRTHARVLGAVAPIEIPSWLGLLPAEHFATTSFRLLTPETTQTSQEPWPERRAAGGGDGKRYGRFMVHQGGR